MRKDPRCTLQFHAFRDFPDRTYKVHKHDCRSVTAKGTIEILDRAKAFEAFGHVHEMLMTCNGRTMKPLAEHRVPAMYMLKITCPMDQVTDKSEFPLRTVEDVPFVDVYSMPEDNTPFDIRDIIAKRNQGL
nr:hypothetical protein [Faecalibaculum rodentium]